MRIVNLRSYQKQLNEVMFRVDRNSIVGNPFYMNSEAERNNVCDKYQVYFERMLEIETNDAQRFRDYLYEIKLAYDRELNGEIEVVLGCWCYPKRCHAETVKSYIESLF